VRVAGTYLCRWPIRAAITEKGNTVMNITHDTNTKRLITALGVAAAAAVAPALLFAGVGTAHADDDPCYGSLQYSFYCSPASGARSQAPEPLDPFSGPPSVNGWNWLPGCTGGALAALDGEC